MIADIAEIEEAKPCSPLDRWQKKEEGGSVSNGAFHAHGTSVVQHDVLYDRQAQAGAAAFARAGFIHAIKTLEDSREMLRSDAGAEVAHEEFNAVFVLVCPDDNFLTIPRIAQGIADEVAEDLVHGVAIRHDLPIWNVLDFQSHFGGAGIFL